MQTELITNADGSIYHLQLHPQQLADTIILVGDPQRVAQVSRHFDYIEYTVSHREFVTHTGFFGKKRLSVVGTGIGTDNIDIVINELDALKNYDLITHQPTQDFTPLNLVRIGTSGAVQAHIAIDSFLFSAFAIGLDGLLGFYEYAPPPAAARLHTQLMAHSPALAQMCVPQATQASLLGVFEGTMPQGITVTNAGFYAPQGRQLRYTLPQPNFIADLCTLTHDNLQITNFEMETAGIYGLAHLLGHRACSLNAILANRITGEFSTNPQKTIENLILHTLDNIENM
jgi:uridine phosphorylase